MAVEKLIPCDLESDEGLGIGCRDRDDLADVTGRCSRSVCDDGASLIRPTGQVRAELDDDAEGGVIPDIEGVGEGATRSGDRCGTCAEARGGSIEGVFDAFRDPVSICIRIECDRGGKAEARQVLLIGGEGGLASV